MEENEAAAPVADDTSENIKFLGPSRNIIYSFLTAAKIGAGYRRALFRWPGHVLWFLGFVDTHGLQQLHWSINHWTGEQAIAWRDSCLASTNAIAVAAAIFASVGLTALQLDNVKEVHWSVQALMTASMSYGVISLMVATALHKNVSSLSSDLDIRLWLSTGQDTSPERFNKFKLKHFSDLPLQSSASALKLIQAPATFLYVAATMYLLAFGLLYVFEYRPIQIPDRTTSNRNLLIFYVAVIGGAMVYLGILFIARQADRSRRNEAFKTNWLFEEGKEHENMTKLRELIVKLRYE